MSEFQEGLEPKPKNWTGGPWKGRKPGAYQWFETQDPVDYWKLFGQPKILYQDITWRPSFCLDKLGTLTNDTTFFIPTTDSWVLAFLNSPLSWWFAWRTVYHGKDEALRLKSIFMQDYPIPTPTDAQAANCEAATTRLIELTHQRQETTKDILDWLKVEHDIAVPSMRLKSSLDLDSDAFIAEVKKLRGKKPLTMTALRSLREEHEKTIVPAQALAREARSLEHQVSDLVNAAYGLSPADVQLMWETAPPRMPIQASASG